MKTQRIPLMARSWLALALLLTLVPWAAIAREAPTLDEQLIRAAARGDAAQVKYLLDKGANVNARDHDGWTPLISAAGHGSVDILELLLEKSADVNARTKSGETALMRAAGFGHTEAVRLLLDKGANANACDARGWSALRHAAADKRTDTAKLLRARGAKVPLIIAAILGDIEETERLIGLGADLDERDEAGSTALIEAIRHENVEVVKVLLEHGADPNETDNEDVTALMMAALTGRVDVAKLLIAKGADVNARDITGWTALSYNADGSTHTAMERCLKQAGAVDRWVRPASRTPAVAHPVGKKRKDKVVTGELVALSPESMSIRVSNSRSSEVVTVEKRSTTAYGSPRAPRVGDKVQVRYRDKGGGKVAEQVRILSVH